MIRSTNSVSMMDTDTLSFQAVTATARLMITLHKQWIIKLGTSMRLNTHEQRRNE